ncbi:unannotated protein [freshwater metagenome]|uniref:Unannotated protein n=1 Tax=freshwater metagenome TaxID=449393 RepID=A0A6J6NA50_9ZZZZ
MFAMSSATNKFPADTPMNTSAPTMASFRVPVLPVALVAPAIQPSDEFGSMSFLPT